MIDNDDDIVIVLS